MIDLWKERVSLRRYAPEPVREEDMEAILSAVLSSPTAGNQMLYSVLKIEDQKAKERIAELCNQQKFIAAAPTVLVFLADQYKWYSYYGLNGVPEYAGEEGIVYHPPGPADLLLAFEDTMIAAHSAVIAAESLGIGSCYVGSSLVNEKELAEFLNLPEYVVPLMVLPMGYYPKNFKRVHSQRFEKRFVVFNETYHRLNKEELKEMFRSREEQYSRHAETQSNKNFAQFYYIKKTGSSFMKRMAQSLECISYRWNSKHALSKKTKNTAQ